MTIKWVKVTNLSSGQYSAAKRNMKLYSDA